MKIDAPIKFELPIWNGIQEKPGVSAAKLEINYSDLTGIYIQTGKRIIQYEKNYKHMTPLGGSNYIENLRMGKIDWILNSISKCDKVLEIGGGDSSNYKHFDCEKYTIIDPSIKQNEKTSKLTLITDYFENVTLNEKYDLVLLISVLEHVDNPNQIIEKAYNVLKDDGSMFVFIPIIEKQFAIGDFNALVHEHINYFTYLGAKNLFIKNKLLVDSYYFKNDGGFFKLVKGQSSINKNENFDLNKISYIFKYQYERFRNLLSGNGKILFYGATNGLNNLFYLIGDNIDYEQFRVTDSDPTKWNKFISSHPLPILSLDHLKNYKTVCISALSFYDQIAKSILNDKIILATGSI